MTLPSMKWMGVALVTQLVMNACQCDKGNMVLATEGTLNTSNNREPSVIKVSEQMHSNAFKRRLTFSFTVILLV